MPDASTRSGQPSTLNRRDFLKGSAKGAVAAAAVPTIIPASALGKDGRKSPSDRFTVGFIGTGSLGNGHHLSQCLGNKPIRDQIDVAAVCDVDRNRRNDAAQRVKKMPGNRRVGIYNDYRELLERTDLDAVFVVTPDHWHTLPCIAAMECGLDVYCEKPLTLTIEEAQAIVAAARRYGAVFQTGSQQRSSGQFHQACELVRNGKIGKISRVDTVLHGVSDGDWIPPKTPPPELDWNFWLGQAPYVDYAPNRVHYQFRWFLDYSGGVMTDWGAHHNDIAQWALGMDGSGPVYVDGTKCEFSKKGMHTAPKHFDVHYKYANGVDLYCHTRGQKYDDGTEFGNGVKFKGSDGWIFVSRSEIKASDPDILKSKFGPNDVRLYKSDNHHLDWIDCMKTREKPICDVAIGASSVVVCHLGNISMQLGRPLKWNPDKMEFIGDDAANAMRRRPMRAPWHL